MNLAVALARRGLTVGILDADIWGFSVPRLLGMEGEVEARKGKMVPLEQKVGDGLVRVLSMGFLADEEQAIMWRGLVLNRAVQQFLQDAHWGDLDYLLIDLPPGTGDVQMGLARLLPRTEMLVVTTPPLAAQKVAARAADMARKGYLRVAGVIENMSDFTCEHGTTYALFGSGGGAGLAHGLGVPLIGSIPLHPDLAAAGDAGTPVAGGRRRAGHRSSPSWPGWWPRRSPRSSRRRRCSARLVERVRGRRGQRRRPRARTRATSATAPPPSASAVVDRCPSHRPRRVPRPLLSGSARPSLAQDTADGPTGRTWPPGAGPR